VDLLELKLRTETNEGSWRFVILVSFAYFAFIQLSGLKRPKTNLLLIDIFAVLHELALT
jgi:hypothetical protein